MNYIRDNMFVISCAARTGSTMLVHMLRSNPRIICHGEVYNGNQVGALTVNYRVKRQNGDIERELLKCYQEQPTVFFYKYLYDLQGRLAAGFKFKTDELFLPDYHRVSSLLGGDKDIKVIHLYREDLVGQFISHQVVLRQTGVTLITSPSERPRIESFTVDLDEFSRYVEDVFRREQASLDFYATHRSFFVSYEQAVREEDVVLTGLQEFIGVPPVQLKKGTEKIIDEPLENVVTNVREIQEAYAEFEARRPIKNLVG